MQTPSHPRTSPLLVSRNPRTVELALSAAAAAGADLQVAREPHQIRAAWRAAPVVMVGAELAALVCGMGLESRLGVHIVGQDQAELVQWSAVLQASVVVLPEGSATLTSLLDEQSSGAGDATVVRLLGGSGGLGVSTLCCALAQRAADRGLSAAVVELDPTGGGLDLVFGAETAPGWRWPELRSASGHLDSLAGRLPNVSGVDIVAHGRPWDPSLVPPGAAALPGPAAVRAVLASLSRTHSLVVLDGGSGQALDDGWPGQRELLLCGGDVRGVVAARSRAASLGLHDLELVVRTGAARRIAPEAVAESLGLPLLGRIGDDRGVTRAAEDAVPVARGRARRGYRRQVDALLDEVAA